MDDLFPASPAPMLADMDLREGSTTSVLDSGALLARYDSPWRASFADGLHIFSCYVFVCLPDGCARGGVRPHPGVIPVIPRDYGRAYSI